MFSTFTENKQTISKVQNAAEAIKVTTPAVNEETEDEDEQKLRASDNDVYQKCFNPKYAHICNAVCNRLRPGYPYPSRPGYPYPPVAGYPYPPPIYA